MHPCLSGTLHSVFLAKYMIKKSSLPAGGKLPPCTDDDDDDNGDDG